VNLLKGAWKVLVGVKDALVLVFLLLFFAALYAALTFRPMTSSIGTGALMLDLNGAIVEQPAEQNPLAVVGGGSAPVRDYRLRDVVRALDTAVTDSRVKAVVLDLDSFTGGGQVALGTVGDALQRVRDAGKPVLAYATGYTDDAYQLAAHASEIWLNPMGIAAFTGPGGTQLYYKGLIDRLGVTAHVYRVGAFKSAVEPYTRTDQSPEARRANETLAAALWQAWQADVAAARPRARLAAYIADPAAGGDTMAQAAIAAGIVDKLGDRTAFGKRVAELAGVDTGKPIGAFRRIAYDDWVAANPLPSGGQIGVVTVAGTIVDGEAPVGSAGGRTIANLIHKGLAENSLKALVVRIDSPGGSALASEQIRSALLDARQAGLPIVVSMGSVAASGGYWIAAAGDHIFAEPATITGSIGVFGVLPTFEAALAKIGVTTDGIATTPLSGQPDLLGGTTPEFDRLMQSGVEDIYGRFLSIVADARKLPVARVDEIGQGRVWDGGTARQLRLVDQFGSLDAAVAEAARRARIAPADARVVYLETPPNLLTRFLQDVSRPDPEDAGATDLLTRMARRQGVLLLNALADARALANGPAIQARCLECGAFARARPAESVDPSVLRFILNWIAR
jgi:protease-4